MGRCRRRRKKALVVGRVIGSGGEMYASQGGSSSDGSSGSGDSSYCVVPPRPPPPPPPPVSVTSSGEQEGGRVLHYLSIAVKNRALASIDPHGYYTCPCSAAYKPVLWASLEEVASLAGQPELTASERAWLHRAHRCKTKMGKFRSVEALQVGRY